MVLICFGLYEYREQLGLESPLYRALASLPVIVVYLVYHFLCLSPLRAKAEAELSLQSRLADICVNLLNHRNGVVADRLLYFLTEVEFYEEHLVWLTKLEQSARQTLRAQCEVILEDQNTKEYIVERTRHIVEYLDYEPLR